tara:strand:+ start:76 stop:600 length:525 start_codon:yes stop_codon:yes gene_type:complete
MNKTVEFTVKPKLIVDLDSQKSISLKSDSLSSKVREQILKDFVSAKCKKHLYTAIFEGITNDPDDLSQYIDGKVVSITYNPGTFSFTVKLEVFLAKQLPKKVSSLKKSELLKEYKILELATRENIIETIKMNIDYFYRASGHFKNYRVGTDTLYLDITMKSDKDKSTIGKFKIV